MRIVVTGGTGFVGRALVDRLKSEGHRVVVVSRAPEKAAKELGLDEAYDWDSLHRCFAEPVEAVVHLAGETVQGRWSEKKAKEVWDSRIATTTKLARAIEEAEQQPKVWVSASGIGFYGEGGERVLQESDGAGDDFFARLCVEWEGVAMGAQTSDMRVVCARFGIVLGADGGALSAMLLPAKSGLSGPLGSGKQWWSWVSLKDAVEALVFCVECDALHGPTNVVSPNPIRQADFQKELCRALHRPAWMPAPAFAVRLLLGRFADEVLSSKRVEPKALKNAGFAWSQPELWPLLSTIF